MNECTLLADADAVYLDASILPKIDIEEDTGSRVARLLIYGTRIPIFVSFVGLGEFFNVAGKKVTQSRIGTMGYLYGCRALLKDIEMGKIGHVEPPEERFDFIKLADAISSRHGRLGGGDVWHLMAVLQLKAQHRQTVFVSFDAKLVEAASNEGLAAVNGGEVDPDELVLQLKSRAASGSWYRARAEGSPMPSGLRDCRCVEPGMSEREG